MKKIFPIILVFALVLTLLTGCDKTGATTTTTTSAKAATNMSVTVQNSSGYIFNELYVTPTADTQWGEDHLGSTSVLKKGGSYKITLPVYQFNTYDIRVVDEDDDVYLFERVPLKDGCKVDIVWENELGASITYTQGDDVYVAGTFESSNGLNNGDPGTTWIEMTFFNDTDWDFPEVYVCQTGSEDLGYNHVATGSLNSQKECAIGVDYYAYYDIQILDTASDIWRYEGVLLDEGCYVEIMYVDNEAELCVSYTDGSTLEYVGDIY